MRIRIVAALNGLLFVIMTVLAVRGIIAGGPQGWTVTALCALIIAGQVFVTMQMRRAQGGRMWGPNRTVTTDAV